MDASLKFICHEAAGTAHCWQLCSNMDLPLPLVAIKWLALVIAGKYLAMWIHHCHLVAIKLLALVITGNYVAITFKIASEAVEAAQS